MEKNQENLKQIIVFLHYISSSIHKTDVQEMFFKKIDHNTVNVGTKVSNHGIWLGSDSGLMVGGPF